MTHCRYSHSQPCATSAEDLQPWSLHGRVGRGVWPEETHSGSSRAAAPVTAASGVIPELPSLGGYSESLLGVELLNLMSTVMHLI